MNLEVIKFFIGQGIFCSLFVWLLMDTRKDSKERELKYQEREVKYQEIIGKITEKFNIVEDIKNDVDYIKEKISK